MDHNLNIQLEKKSGGLSRRVLIIVFVVLVAAPLVVLVTWQFVARYQGQRAVEELAVRLQTYEQDLLNAKMEDRYGGSTPQETLSLYIRAVESGDYELATTSSGLVTFP
jgi:flagellar basal body-associated protein FliL